VNDCSPEIFARTEVAVRNLAVEPTCPNAGKAEVLWEVTGTRTAGAAGVGVQASGERWAELKSGRSCRPAAERPSGVDPPTSPRVKAGGGGRTGT